MAADPSDKRTRIGTPAPRTSNPTGGQPVYPAQTPAPVATPPPYAPAVTPAPAPAATPAPYQGSSSAPFTIPSELPANIPAAGVPAYAQPVDPLLGQVLAGRYLIQKKLGEGGMGSVYLATHTVLEKHVALKVLHAEYSRKPDLVERFMQEAKAASRIRHENVIDISDFGATPDGLVFFAMELLRGHDLHEEIARARLAGRRLPWERTRPIFLQVCSALSAAHAQGIVHRDLKPENIYLVEFLGQKDFVKLLDFGIAKLTEVSDGDRKLTRTGMLFGTPEYMSPEQARGENVDHRVDIYAMGCILYQMVTGRVPFEAENFMGILSLHLTEIPPPIGAPILNEIGAPLGVEAIIMKALAKNRDDRFQTIDEMANAIRALHGEAQVPVQQPSVPIARPTGPRTQWTGQVTIPTEDDVERAPRAPRGRSKVPLAIGAVLVAGGVGAGAFYVTRGGSSGGGTGSNEPKPAVTIDAGAKVAAATPGGADAAAAPSGPVPARVHLTIDSVPEGADIFDLTTQKSLGPTPMEFDIAGSHEARRYRLSLKGYIAKVIELTPDEEVPPFTANLTAVKGGAGTGTGTAVAAEEVEVVPHKSQSQSQSQSQKKTGTGTGTGTGASSASDVGPVTSPDQTPDQNGQNGKKEPEKKQPVEKKEPEKKEPEKKQPVEKKQPEKKEPEKKEPEKKTTPPPDTGSDDEPHIKDPFHTGG